MCVCLCVCVWVCVSWALLSSEKPPWNFEPRNDWETGAAAKTRATFVFLALPVTESSSVWVCCCFHARSSVCISVCLCVCYVPRQVDHSGQDSAAVCVCHRLRKDVSVSWMLRTVCMTSLERCNSVNDMTGHNVFILLNILITRYQTFYPCVLHVTAELLTWCSILSDLLALECIDISFIQVSWVMHGRNLGVVLHNGTPPHIFTCVNWRWCGWR